MCYLYDDEYKSKFKTIINEFKEFKKNIIIKEKKKFIEGFKVVNSNKYQKKTLYLENLEITFKNYYYYFDIKLFFEKFNNYKKLYKFKVKKEIKKYLFYMFLNIYKSQNIKVQMFTTGQISLNPIEVIDINNSFYFLYDLKSGKFIVDKKLSKLIFLYNDLFNKIDKNNINIEEIIKKYKKINKEKLNEKIDLLISKKNELYLIKNKNNTLFYNYANKKVLNFDINFNELKIDKDNLELMLKQITDMSINYEIDYYKNGPFDVIYHYAEKNLFFNGKKINKNHYIYTYKGEKCYCLQDNNILDLYNEKEKIKTIEINQEENRNNIFNFINYKDIVEIKNNTNMNIKKLDNCYEYRNKDCEVIIYDGINKQFDIIYENYEFNLIGIILDSEFFILKRNSELLKGKNINVIYKKLINNRDLLEKENNKCNMIFNF
jgi:hypothetical protein